MSEKCGGVFGSASSVDFVRTGSKGCTATTDKSLLLSVHQEMRCAGTSCGGPDNTFVLARVETEGGYRFGKIQIPIVARLELTIDSITLVDDNADGTIDSVKIKGLADKMAVSVTFMVTEMSMSSKLCN